MAAPDQLYRAVTRIFSVVIIGFGAAMLIVTLARGGSIGSVGLWLGMLFIAVGVGRLYIALRSRS
jgi:lipopolysaccharide export LptBFGC system permease protein LptF